MSRDRLMALLVGIPAVSVFLTPFRRELFVGDETKYAQVIREVRAGAFFLPTLHGSPFTHKPPLHFWLIDALTYPFGMYSTWPYVLPSIAAFIALLWLMWRAEGAMAAFVCGTSLMVWGSAQTARMDVEFTLFIALAALLIRRFLEGGHGLGSDKELLLHPSRTPHPPSAPSPPTRGEGSRGMLLLAAAAIGVATLIKGPMAPVIAIFLLIFEWMRRKRLPRGNYAGAIAIMAVIPLLWFIPAMRIGGDAYTHDVLVKQTAGRAVGAWVHQAAPWFYIAHGPGDLFPWFFLLIAALVAVYKRGIERAPFYVSWILAVLVPYSLISSKLDVYMMALIPPAALLMARFATNEVPDRWSRWGWRANLLMLGVLLGLGVYGFVALGRLKEPYRMLAVDPAVRGLFICMSIAAVIGLVVSIWSRSLFVSTVCAGVAPLAAVIYVTVILLPLANDLASTRPAIEALGRQRVPPEQIALYTAPQLWSHDMPRQLERVRYVDNAGLRSQQPAVILTSRKHADEIAWKLGSYRKVDEFRMIGKWFDVYRR